MSAYRGAIAVAIVAGALVAAQFVFAGQALFHTWQYALALVVLAWLLIAHAGRAKRAGAAGARMAVALVGALVFTADGLASGLLGPDTQLISRAPGTILPLPDLQAAAAFSNPDAQTLQSGGATVTLRRRNQPDVIVTPGSRKIFGGSLVFLTPMPAAYVDALDEHGNHLTITQPSGASFLSPVMLFGDRQAIAGQLRPIDSFALPAEHRAVKVVYFNAKSAASFHLPVRRLEAGQPAILYDVLDQSSNRSLGIGVAASGEAIDVGGVRLRSTLGTYPQLTIASVPEPLALAFGAGLFLLGVLTAIPAQRRAASSRGSPLMEDDGGVMPSVRHEEQHRDGQRRIRAGEEKA